MSRINLALLKDGDGLTDRRAIPIGDADGTTLGYLVPIGGWILERPEIIASIARWRQVSMAMFLAQFVSTAPKTRNYLANLSIGRFDRILFMIRTLEEQDVGHIGLANITADEAELDNVMRGEPDGHPRLIYFALVAILAWGFSALAVRKISARVLSYNWRAIRIYQEVGFIEATRLALKKTVEGEDISHLPISPGEQPDVSYVCLELALTQELLFSNVRWLRREVSSGGR